MVYWATDIFITNGICSIHDNKFHNFTNLQTGNKYFHNTLALVTNITKTKGQECKRSTDGKELSNNRTEDV